MTASTMPSAALRATGFAGEEWEQWLAADPDEPAEFVGDCKRFAEFWTRAARLLEKLPAKTRRSEPEQATASMLQEHARAARVRFLRRHVDAVYDALTQRRSRFVRVEELVFRAADLVPGLVPCGSQLAAENGWLQRDKHGQEIDQGLFLAAVLQSPPAGRHLCQAMLLARAEAQPLLAQFQRDGVMELTGACLNRYGKAAVLTHSNPRFLNAEDQTTL